MGREGLSERVPRTPRIAQARSEGTTSTAISGGDGTTERRTEVESPAYNARARTAGRRMMSGRGKGEPEITIGKKAR